ncbi:MAG TPA: hypothetical protein VFM98_14355 [Ramlibacter sp.]|uniref:hypothetical protein n=1 Tax=Ramlibacter sp. TaxID=1917967 RepID=UPI002D7FF3AF|nr:hypothetical protein [Ramlibacter sp.]HET8746785.1 hypothetical protein [Ramlibacter sp.]
MNDDIPLDANGPAYTSSQERHGIPLDYVGDKLGTAIEELHRFALKHPQHRGELIAPMYYMLVAHLGLHNMLAKANDRTLASRLLEGTSDDLRSWLAVIQREGDVAGLAGLDGTP